MLSKTEAMATNSPAARSSTPTAFVTLLVGVAGVLRVGLPLLRDEPSCLRAVHLAELGRGLPSGAGDLLGLAAPSVEYGRHFGLPLLAEHGHGEVAELRSVDGARGA